MRYRIGELADFFGMTKEGVRYLERQGVIRSERDGANGYRYFPRTEITRLKMIRSLQAIGFTMEEARQLFLETTQSEILDRLDEKLGELESKETQLRQMKRTLMEQRAAFCHAIDQAAHYEVILRPEYVLFPRVEDEASGGTPGEKRAIAERRQAEKAWIQAMPPVRLGAIHYDASGKRKEELYGCAALREDVEKLGLPVLPCMHRIPACRCIYACVESVVGKRPDVGGMFAWARAQKLQVCGDIFGTIQMTYRGETGQILRLHGLYAPVCENK